MLMVKLLRAGDMNHANVKSISGDIYGWMKNANLILFSSFTSLNIYQRDCRQILILISNESKQIDEESSENHLMISGG